MFPTGLTIQKVHFASTQFCKINLCRHIQDDAKAVGTFDFRIKTHILADADFQEWHQFKVKADRKKIISVFGFWLTVSENNDFVAQYLANNSFFGDASGDFLMQSLPSCKYTNEENCHLIYLLITTMDLQF